MAEQPRNRNYDQLRETHRQVEERETSSPEQASSQAAQSNPQLRKEVDWEELRDAYEESLQEKVDADTITHGDRVNKLISFESGANYEINKEAQKALELKEARQIAEEAKMREAAELNKDRDRENER
jgi:D-aminopeptidase